MDENLDFPGPLASPPRHGYTIQIFGSLLVRRGTVLLDASHLGGQKARQVLEILLIELGTPVSKSRLIDRLWSGSPPPDARATLESHVSILRRHLQPGAGKSGPLKTVAGGYVLDETLIDLDFAMFDQFVRRAATLRPVDALPVLEHALALAEEPLFGDELLAPWALEQRAVHARRITEVMVLASKKALAAGLTPRAIRWSNAALETDPLNESAWSILLASLEREGRFVEGLAAYDECRRLLHDELGCEPDPTIRAAHRRLLQKTIEDEDDLTDVMAALLLLHDHPADIYLRTPVIEIALAGARYGSASGSSQLLTAMAVVTRFLQRAPSTVEPRAARVPQSVPHTTYRSTRQGGARRAQ